MEPLKINEIVSAVKGKLIQNESILDENEVIITGISTDSREISCGDLFIPIKGENFDGHNFILQAFEKGVKVCLSERRDILVPKGKLLIQVENTKQALMDLATYYRSLFSIPVVAVTGSVGKTSTKDMIASVLSQHYMVLKTQGNYNNEIGVPLTIFQLNKEHEAAVIEMGMNHFGEIHNLSKIAKPNIAVITNIGVSHIENLGSQEGILQAKCEIFDYLKEDGIVVLNGDDHFLKTLKGKIPFEIVYFGLDAANQVYAKNIQSLGVQGTEADFVLDKEEVHIQIPSPGKHMVYNALCAFAVGLKLNLTFEEIQKGILTYQSSKMRMDIFKTKKNVYIINDVYNASPHSMKAALNVLNEISDGRRKIAILGDMLEMGFYSEQAHKEVGEYAAKNKIDYLFCIGTEANHIAQGAINGGMDKSRVKTFLNQEILWNTLEHFIASEDTILIKASRGMHLEKTVEKIKEVE
ncbi:MAG: UDP-N-acetylmuramoyl-tripeptide--D-alanyl-D-alanine ligase [Epulopiscium sp.]|nr:UDP-N-acetylmuramoyl-tripeptide--D-alanyl-D-alanine ligase [Candidatus Epulonipiscium sp.]